jgi:hypothetical protein
MQSGAAALSSGLKKEGNAKDQNQSEFLVHRIRSLFAMK